LTTRRIFNTKRHVTGPDANLTKKISWPTACLKQS
jgi:hypothetical protein